MLVVTGLLAVEFRGVGRGEVTFKDAMRNSDTRCPLTTLLFLARKNVTEALGTSQQFVQILSINIYGYAKERKKPCFHQSISIPLFHPHPSFHS